MISSAVYMYKTRGKYQYLLFPFVYLSMSIAFYLFLMNEMHGYRNYPRALSYFIFGSMPMILFAGYGIWTAFTDWKNR